MPTLEEISKAPANINDWFTSLSQHVAESRRVIEDLSKEDPPMEPFRSKYAGRNMLKAALERAQTFDPFTDQEIARIRLAQTTLFYYLGTVSIDVEEPQEAQKYFKSALDILELEPTLKYNVHVRLSVLNVFATVWSGRGEHDKAYELLERGKELYAAYIHNKDLPPYALDEIFMDEKFADDERVVLFEKTYTNTLFYLAQVYGVKGDNKQAAAHCHITLQRQLESDDFDPLDWSLNCATLSQYYITMGNYKSARHTLACASSVMSNIDESSGTVGYSDEAMDTDKIRKTRADIERCWIKYSVNLIQDSVKEKEESEIADKVPELTEIKNTFEDEVEKEEEEEEKKDEEKEEEEGEGENNPESEEKPEETPEEEEEKEKKKRKTFSDLVDIEDIELLRITNVETGQYEELVGDELCTTYEEARKLFKAGAKFTENAVQFYTFDEYVTDHVEIKQDLSKLYKGLTHFSTDESAQCKMHKRRVDILTELVTPLNIQHFLQVCRQLRFELGEARNQMVTLKYSIAAEKTPDQQNWKKINNLCYAAIQEFEHFIDLLKDPSGNFPDTLSEATVKPYIICRVYIARLYGKLRPSDVSHKVEFLGKAIENFKIATDYYDGHDVRHLDVGEEINIAREMIHFLPVKIEKLKRMEK